MNTYKIFEFSSIKTYSEFKVKVKVKKYNKNQGFWKHMG